MSKYGMPQITLIAPNRTHPRRLTLPPSDIHQFIVAACASYSGGLAADTLTGSQASSAANQPEYLLRSIRAEGRRNHRAERGQPSDDGGSPAPVATAAPTAPA